MIKNRTTVLTAVIENVNAVLAQHKIVSTRDLQKFDLKESIPTSASGVWDIKVASYTELLYLNKFNTPSLVTGTNVLVESDSESNGFWAIYTFQSDSTFKRTQVQSYDTTQYWQYQDWYEIGYSKDSLINLSLIHI